jgi:GSCFA family
MELRTTFSIDPSPRKITFKDPVMFIGSCFATSIGSQFELGRMPVMINPAGTVYNPVSVCNTIDTITSRKKYDSGNLYKYADTYISFDHYTDFSSGNSEEILNKINSKSEEGLKFLSNASFLFVTFGTARVFRWSESGKIVSNCHKIPAARFTHDILSPNDITSLWNSQLDKMKSLFPDLKVVFTISPVRHWKDGAHGNQVSKSVLFLAIEKLLGHPSKPSYFPAYELVMDDLRDYRFYDNDMLHLSDRAVDYIWEAFCHCYFDKATTGLWKEISKISKAVLHRIQSVNKNQIREFAENIISRIDLITEKNPIVNLEKERKYFVGLLESSGDEGN